MNSKQDANSFLIGFCAWAQLVYNSNAANRTNLELKRSRGGSPAFVFASANRTNLELKPGKRG